jgi:hypothetical protein
MVAASSVQLSTDLLTAPLHIERDLRIDGGALLLRERVTNGSPDPIEIAWGHHPAFGAPFLESGCVIRASARTFRADDSIPGTVLEPGSIHGWPLATSIAGELIDLSVIPGPESRQAVFGYLSDFEEPWYAITNPKLSLGLRFRWPLDVFPHAWYWQEIHASSDFPWFRRAYVQAIEPHTTVPASGLSAAKESGGGGITLAGGECRAVEIEVSVLRAAAATGQD